MIARISTFWAIFLAFCNPIFAQSYIKGTVTDAKSGQSLPGVNVAITDSTGAATDADGAYLVQVANNYHIEFRFTGYGTQIREGFVRNGDTLRMDIKLSEQGEQLDVVVVSGSKYERKLTDESVTIEVIKGDLIKNTNSVTLSEAVDKIAGVNIYDNQATIRGGSGYAFGAGSRVLLLLDDMPLLTVDRSEIKWNLIPLEITDQVEVSKSAASALYGASALNGVINVRTAQPKEKPETEAILYYNGFGPTKDPKSAWWDSTTTVPFRYGGSIYHKRKIGPVDIVASASMNKTIGFIRMLDTDFHRLTLKFRHRPTKIKGLSYGLGINFMDSNEADYFFWKDAGDGKYIPFGSNSARDRGTISAQRRRTVLIDPNITYLDNYGNKHTIRGRFSNVDLKFTEVNPHAQLLFGEYQFQRRFNFGLNIIAGTTGQYYTLKDQDLGDHYGKVFAAYTQVAYTIGRLNAFVGFRYERFDLDKLIRNGRPVTSAGLNFRAGKQTYLRTSFGQGYRFPSIGERFVNESVEGINIFPNPELKPEYGFNGELGLKQGVKISKFLAFIDVSFFWMEYWDMTEFFFDYYAPDTLPPNPNPLDYLGFKATNVSRARIAGYEVSILGEGKLGPIPVRWQGGYTYNYGVDLNSDTTLRNVGNYLSRFVQSLGSKDANVVDPMLKYRARHLFKSDIELDLWHFTLGVDTRVYGFVEKVDQVFEAFIPGLKDYRTENNTASFLLNLRLSYNFNKFGKATFIVNNALNQEISIRPARMEPPVNFVIQYKITI
ncbi:MAG: TonB-dependent receptor [Chitinophagales bacterium]|nr:TonB-dependent receptor [Chitinophagales bacterium]